MVGAEAWPMGMSASQRTNHQQLHRTNQQVPRIRNETKKHKETNPHLPGLGGGVRAMVLLDLGSDTISDT